VKNIVFINHFAGVPGINERSLRHFILSKNSISNGDKSTIITSQNHYQSLKKDYYSHNNTIDIDGINFIFIKESSYNKVNLLTKFFKMISFSKNLFFAFLFRKIKLDRVDIVYASSPDLFSSLVAYYIAKRKKAKFILEIRDIWPLSQIVIHKFSPKHPVILLMRSIELFLLKKSDHIISTLNNYKLYLDENNIKTEYTFVPQVVNNTFIKEKISINIPYANFEKVGIYAGSVGSLYRIENFINSFPVHLKDKICIIIIGDGDRWKEIKRLIDKKNLPNFFITNSQPRSILQNYYDIADFGISIHPVEAELHKYGFSPLKIIDYMNAKLPILFVGDSSLFDDNSLKGLIESKFDEKALIESFISILELSKEEMIDMGNDNYNFVNNNNSIDVIKDNIEAIFESISNHEK
jgi:hypothetical protein